MLPKYEAWDVNYLRDPPTRSDAPNIVQLWGFANSSDESNVRARGRFCPGNAGILGARGDEGMICD